VFPKVFVIFGTKSFVVSKSEHFYPRTVCTVIQYRSGRRYSLIDRTSSQSVGRFGTLYESASSEARLKGQVNSGTSSEYQCDTVALARLVCFSRDLFKI
jgi:hypothetical protein